MVTCRVSADATSPASGASTTGADEPFPGPKDVSLRHAAGVPRPQVPALNVRHAAAARRYARALLDVALAQGDPATVKADLDRLAAAVAGSLELRTALEHPAIPAEKKKAIVAAVGRAHPPSALVERLAGLLIDHQRTEILPDLARAFSAARNTHRGVVEAEAVSAEPLDEMQRLELRKAAEMATGRTVELTTATNPAVLGGVLLRMEGRVYDGTVRARLSALRAQLLGGRGAA